MDDPARWTAMLRLARLIDSNAVVPSRAQALPTTLCPNSSRPHMAVAVSLIILAANSTSHLHR